MSPTARKTTAPAGAPKIVETTFATIALGELAPSTSNLRRNLDDIEGLAQSIAAVGLIEPLVVERCANHDAGDHGYHVLAGHRRLAAATKAGLTEVPCTVREPITDGERVELIIVENLQRRDLDPLEEAEGYRQLVELGRSQRSIAHTLTVSQSHVSKRLALLSLPVEYRNRIDKETLTIEAAVALTKLVDNPAALKRAAAHHDPVRGVESELTAIATAEAIDKLVTAAKAKGWKILKTLRWPEKPKYSTIGTYRDLDLDAKKHQAEPCHGVLIPDRQYQAPKALDPVCTDRKRHAAKGDSALKLPVSRKPAPTAYEKAQLEKDRQRRDAIKTRREALQTAVAKPDSRVATRLALQTLIGDVDVDVARIACELMALEPVDGRYNGKDYRAPLVTRSAKNLVQVALAVALATGEEVARRPYSSAPLGLYDYLTSAGYEPTPWEAERIAEARKDDEEDQRELDLLDEGDTFYDGGVNTPEDIPLGALAWYRGFSDAEDPPRFLDDEDEATALLALYPERVDLLGDWHADSPGITDLAASQGSGS